MTATRKPCGNPRCSNVIPLTWTWCKGRTCQDQRTRCYGSAEFDAGWDEYNRRKHERDVRANRAARRYQQHLTVEGRRRAQSTIMRNATYRKRAFDEAVASANGELLDLILKQAADAHSRQGQPRWVRSLDAAIFGDEAQSLHDRAWDQHTSGVWSDPTYEAVLVLLGLDA